MYVSDLLEGMLEASTTRQMVRDECVELLDKLPWQIAVPLQPIADYIGGKCMGYPAVWFIQQATGISDLALRDVLQRGTTAVFISLSTSIADDFLDRDESVSGKHLMFFYVLLLEAIARRPEPQSGVVEFIRSQMVDAMDLFIGEGDSPDAGPAQQDVHRRGKRIGNFFRGIAFDLMRHMPAACVLPEADVVRDAGRFGDWCAALDDAIDVEPDITTGQHDSFPIRALSDLDPRAGEFVRRRDVSGLAPLLSSARLADSTAAHLGRQLEQIEADVLSYSEGLATRLRVVRGLIPQMVLTIRQRAHAEFMRRRQDSTSVA